jgi:ParB family chromosome partitioning protein
MTPTRPISAIQVRQRHRVDMGDLAGLAESLSQLGLLQPVVVRPDGRLIAGERRLRAAKLLNWTTIPVNVVDIDAIVDGELAENIYRKTSTRLMLSFGSNRIQRETDCIGAMVISPARTANTFCLPPKVRRSV